MAEANSGSTCKGIPRGISLRIFQVEKLLSPLAASASARPFNFTFMRQFSASWPLFDNDYVFRQISVWILKKLQISRDEFELVCRSFEHPWRSRTISNFRLSSPIFSITITRRSNDYGSDKKLGHDYHFLPTSLQLNVIGRGSAESHQAPTKNYQFFCPSFRLAFNLSQIVSNIPQPQN